MDVIIHLDSLPLQVAQLNAQIIITHLKQCLDKGTYLLQIILLINFAKKWMKTHFTESKMNIKNNLLEGDRQDVHGCGMLAYYNLV